MCTSTSDQRTNLSVALVGLGSLGLQAFDLLAQLPDLGVGLFQHGLQLPHIFRLVIALCARLFEGFAGGFEGNGCRLQLRL
jgi:hypothetical protein